MLHVHENVKDTEEAQWLEYLVSTIESIAVGNGSLKTGFRF